MKERTWLGILLSFAAPCRGKMAGSVVLAILSVAGGFVPYLGVYQIIRLFLERQADWEGIVFWCGVCLAGYAVKVAGYALSTMLAQGEKLQNFVDDLKYVSHVHISEPGLAPIQKRPEHKELALLLGAVGYRGFVSVEMARTDLSALPAGERDVLMLLACRLLCATAQPHRFEAVLAVLESDGHTFTAKGKTILHEGWKGIEQAFRASLKQKQPEDGDENTSRLPELKEGQRFEKAAATTREGKTSPPKHYTEDSLLAAMETAGAEDMPEDAERKGLGTSATRAATLEKLVSTGFVQRKKKQLLPTDKGVNLIAVLPDVIKSPALTAEWESMLKQVERGEMTADAFMEGIAGLIRDLIRQNTAPDPAYFSLFGSKNAANREAVGTCPRCGGVVYEGKKGFFCENESCAFALWKENRFFSSKKKTITKTIAAALLKEGRVSMSGLFSEKTGKTYDAVVVLDDTGEKYVNFKLEFPQRRGRKK